MKVEELGIPYLRCRGIGEDRSGIHNFNAYRFSSVYPKYEGGRPPNPAGPDRRRIAAVIGVTLSA